MGLNERREQNDKNKFPQMPKFIEILSKVSVKNVPVKFKSNLIEQFEQVFDDLGPLNWLAFCNTMITKVYTMSGESEWKYTLSLGRSS